MYRKQIEALKTLEISRTPLFVLKMPASLPSKLSRGLGSSLPETALLVTSQREPLRRICVVVEGIKAVFRC